MKKYLASAVLLLLSPAWTASQVRAEQKPFVMDRSHCQINFVADALLISARGYFERFDADIQIDQEKIENSAVSITIESASLNTSVAGRDTHLRSADFFDVANHPQIKFVSSKVSRVDDQNLKITGDLTLRGVTKTLEIPVKIVFSRESDARFKGDFSIDRREFGMTYNSRMNPIEDMVAISFDLHLVDEKAMEERQRQRQQSQPKPPVG